jgi:uncharacterized membrane protein YphA (DoxX/SURF4 family)
MFPYLSLTLRGILAAVLLTSALSKLSDLPGFRLALSHYRLIPRRLQRAISQLVPAVEIVIGFALAFGFWWRAAALSAFVLLLLFTAVLVSRRPADASGSSCGCGGIMPEALPTVIHVLLNLALLAAASAVAVLPTTSMAIPWNGPLGGTVTGSSSVAVLIILTIVSSVVAIYAVRVVLPLRTISAMHDRFEGLQ